MTKQQKSKIKSLESALPELANCDRIINRWAKELMTIFDKGHNKHLITPSNASCKKHWHQDTEYNEHWHLEVESDEGKRQILVSSSLGIINSDVKHRPSLIIFASQPSSTEAVMFFWADRFKQYKWVTFTKIDKSSFKISGSDKNEVRQYRKFHINSGKNKNGTTYHWNELQTFCKMSLVASCLKSTRSKGAKVSNQNSQTQSKRKKGKIVNDKYVLMEFDCPEAFNDEKKTVLDAYKICAGKYNYKKSLRQFHRDLEKGQLRLEMDSRHSVCCTLMMTSSQLNIVYNIIRKMRKL